MAEVNLDPYVYKIPPDLVFIDKSTGLPLQVSDVHMSNGQIDRIITLYDDTYSREDIEVIKNNLLVPGLGSISPESRVVYQGKDYVLKFGWHTNISNQVIYSWYLESLEESIPPKTLYLDMINQIDLVHFR